MGIEFQKFPSISRYHREIVITEKIDGTNAAIGIVEASPLILTGDGERREGGVVVNLEAANNGWRPFIVYAQSRKRLITPEDDNFGFARWVYKNAHNLVAVLGEGLHFGEWYGSGIQRGYGLKNGEKYFALFNVSRWTDEDDDPVENLSMVPNLTTVPVLGRTYSLGNREKINGLLVSLREFGSAATGAADYMNPEGIVIYHSHSNVLFKITLEGDDKGKNWGA